MTTLIARAVRVSPKWRHHNPCRRACFGLDKRQQRVGLRDVMDLPTREAERQAVCQGVNDHMIFVVSPRASGDGLVETPFLRAPAEC